MAVKKKPTKKSKPRESADISERKNADLMRQFMTPAYGDVGEADAVSIYRKDALRVAKNNVRLDARQTYYTRNPKNVMVSDSDIRKDQQKEKARKTKQRER